MKDSDIVCSHVINEQDNDGRSSPNFFQKDVRRDSEELTDSEVKAKRYRMEMMAISESNLK